MNGGIADRCAWRLRIAVTRRRRGEVAALGAARHLVRAVRYLFPRPWAAILRIGQARGKVVEHFEVQDAIANPASFLVLRHITRGESAAAGASFVARWAMRGSRANPGGEVK
jgi:hypothetical protein